MQETTYRDRDGNVKKMTEIFEGDDLVLKAKHAEALEMIQREGGELIGITQKVIDPKHPCLCGSGMQYKRCCGK